MKYPRVIQDAISLYQEDLTVDGRFERLSEAFADAYSWRLEESKLLSDFSRRLLALEIATGLRETRHGKVAASSEAEVAEAFGLQRGLPE